MKQKIFVIDSAFDSEAEKLSVRVSLINGKCIAMFDNTTDLIIFLDDELSFVDSNVKNHESAD